eukprot:GHUV01051931.1.p1 GENE.GHUV01051931.1~~GHUV01051931.1.p1  ORF type:complete len:149 (-),score=25.65 GHUV01051931.1:135-581(-)
MSMAPHGVAGLAVITGSTSGIGKAIAVDYSKNGISVVVNGRSQATVDSTVQDVQQHAAAGARVFGIAGDVGTEDGAAKFIADVDALCSKEGLHVSVLVNNAGIFEVANFFEVADSTWQKCVTRSDSSASICRSDCLAVIAVLCICCTA